MQIAGNFAFPIVDIRRHFAVSGNLISLKFFIEKMTSERYSFSLTTFSPSGRLIQVEYALAAVSTGATCVGIKASNGVVLASENKYSSTLFDESSVNRVEMISRNIGMVYSGLGPDYRVLVSKARHLALLHHLLFKEQIPVKILVEYMGRIMQECTQSGGVRPFGVSILICGWYDDKPHLFQCNPLGCCFAWKATALGKHAENRIQFLERSYSEDIELNDAVQTAILTLKKGFEGEMKANNIQVGICDKNGFKYLDSETIKNYIANIS